MEDNIKGKVIVITGASSGMGEAAAKYLSALGASVVLGARRVDRIAELARGINDQGGKALAMATDVTQRNQVKKLVDTAAEQFGRVDVILNNAGVMPLSPIDRLNVDEWDTMIDVNLKGVLNGIAAVLPYMKAQKSGQIINTSSVAGHKVFTGSAVYSATKFAVRALTEGLRMEVKHNAGIMVPMIDTTEMSVEEFDKAMAINLKGVWLCMKYELLQMKKQGSGAIVNNSSIGGLVGGACRSAYIAAKHGVLGLTKCAAIEYAHKGIRINAVCPGTIETPMVDRMFETGDLSREAATEGAPIKRLGKPSEIAEAVLWLFSPASSYVIGQPISVDGGLSTI